MRMIFVRMGILLCLTVFCTGCGSSPEVKRDKALARAKEFLLKKDFRRAIIECQGAIRYMPKDPEAYYRLGLALEASGDLQSAVKSFNTSLSLNPRHIGARLELGRMMAATIDPAILKDAEARMSALIEDVPNNPDALNTLAMAQLKLGKTDSAIEGLQKALAAAPQHLNSSTLLAQAKLALGDKAGAEAVLRKLCVDAPKSAEARVLMGQFYLAANNDSAADQYLRAALSLQKDDPQALIALAQLQLKQGQTKTAGELLQQLSHSTRADVRPLYGVLLFREKRPEEALREFERLVRADAEDRIARTYLVAAYVAVGRSKDAGALLNAVLKQHPKDADALLQRAEISLSDHRYYEAELDLNNVLHLRPESAEVHYLFAGLHNARGTHLTARQELTEALRLNPYFIQARFELVDILVATNAAKSALKLLDETPSFQSTSTAFLAKRNWVLWALDDLKSMRVGIDAGLVKHRTPEVLIQDALLRLRSNDPTTARTRLDEALKIDPQNIRALQILAQSYAAQKQIALAAEKVQHYAEGQPKSAAVQHFLGTVLLANADAKGARAAFERAAGVDRSFVPAELSLVQLDVAESKWAPAEARLKTLMSSMRGDTTPIRWLANVQEMQGKHEDALKHYRAVLEKDPNDRQALNNVAYLLTDYEHRPDEALPYAQRAVEQTAGNPSYADTLGWVLYSKGLYGAAVKHFEGAVGQGSNVVWKYHLAMAYARAGDDRRAKAAFQAALKQNSTIPEASIARKTISDTGMPNSTPSKPKP